MKMHVADFQKIIDGGGKWGFGGAGSTSPVVALISGNGPRVTLGEVSAMTNTGRLLQQLRSGSRKDRYTGPGWTADATEALHRFVAESTGDLLDRISQAREHLRLPENSDIDAMTNAALQAQRQWLSQNPAEDVRADHQRKLEAARSHWQQEYSETLRTLTAERDRSCAGMTPEQHRDFVESYGTDFPHSEEYDRLQGECEAHRHWNLQLNAMLAGTRWDCVNPGRTAGLLRRVYSEFALGRYRSSTAHDDLSRKDQIATVLNHRLTGLLEEYCEWSRRDQQTG